MELYLKLTKSFSQKYRSNKVLIQKVMNSGSIIILTQKYARVKNNIGCKKNVDSKTNNVTIFLADMHPHHLKPYAGFIMQHLLFIYAL